MMLMGLLLCFSIQPVQAQEPLQVSLDIEQKSSLKEAISYQLTGEDISKDFSITGNSTYPLVFNYTHAGVYQYSIKSLKDTQAYKLTVLIKNADDSLYSEIYAENNNGQKMANLAFTYGDVSVPHEDTPKFKAPVNEKHSSSSSENGDGSNKNNRIGNTNKPLIEKDSQDNQHNKNKNKNYKQNKTPVRVLSAAVKTGDTTNIIIYVLLILFAGAVIIKSLKSSRK